MTGKLSVPLFVADMLKTGTLTADAIVGAPMTHKLRVDANAEFTGSNVISGSVSAADINSVNLSVNKEAGAVDEFGTIPVASSEVADLIPKTRNSFFSKKHRSASTKSHTTHDSDSFDALPRSLLTFTSLSCSFMHAIHSKTGYLHLAQSPHHHCQRPSFWQG